MRAFWRNVCLAVVLCVVFLAAPDAGTAHVGLLNELVPTLGAVQIRTTSMKNVKYCRLNDIAAAYGMKITRTGTTCTLQGKFSKLVLTHNKRFGACNTSKLSFLFAPWITTSSVWISELDYRQVLLPLISPKALTKHAPRTICIDPGHGGTDQGTKGRRYKEKDVNLRVALKLRDRLRALGYRVVMTRSTDITVSLEKRSVIAKNAKADLFLSIHCNAAPNSKLTNGIETYCLTPVGGASTHDATPRNTKYVGNAHDKNGFRIAHEIHRRMVGNTKANDRGVKHARFLVLRNTPCPSVLIELGFLSNDAEERNLGAVVHQDRLVKGIADGVVRYHSLVKQ